MDWTVRVEETRVGLTDDGEFVIVLSHVRARGSDADWRGSITRVGSGAVVLRETAKSAEELMVTCKEWLAAHNAVKERDPYPHNERDPIPAGE